MDDRFEASHPPRRVRDWTPDRDDDFRPDVSRQTQDCLDGGLVPAGDGADADAQRGRSQGHVTGGGASVEAGDMLNAACPHERLGPFEVAADDDCSRRVGDEAGADLAERPDQPFVGDNDEVADVRAHRLCSPRCVDEAVEELS